MPELPEVELVTRDLRESLEGKKLTAVRVIEPYSVVYEGKRLNDKGLAERLFCEHLVNQKAVRITRKGKYISIFFEKATLVVHLKMTGSLIFNAKKSLLKPYLRVILSFEDDELGFYDIRKFGYLEITSHFKARQKLGRLGLDALNELKDAEDLFKLLRSSRKELKKFLLDQHKIAGIGNAYADEILYESGLSPFRPANSLSKQEAIILLNSIKRKLKQGIASGGLTIRNYVNASGRPGNFQEKLMVYGKAGSDCKRCGKRIIRVKFGGRSTHYCSGCQR